MTGRTRDITEDRFRRRHVRGRGQVIRQRRVKNFFGRIFGDLLCVFVVRRLVRVAGVIGLSLRRHTAAAMMKKRLAPNEMRVLTFI